MVWEYSLNLLQAHLGLLCNNKWGTESSSSPLTQFILITMTEPNNVFAKETQPIVMSQEEVNRNLENGERVNGQLAMIGIVAGLGAYLVSGQVIPGVW